MISIDDLLDKHDESERCNAADSRKRANEYWERVNKACTVVDETIRRVFLPKLLELKSTFEKRGYATKLVLNEPYLKARRRNSLK